MVRCHPCVVSASRNDTKKKSRADEVRLIQSVPQADLWMFFGSVENSCPWLLLRAPAHGMASWSIFPMRILPARNPPFINDPIQNPPFIDDAPMKHTSWLGGYATGQPRPNCSAAPPGPTVRVAGPHSKHHLMHWD